MNVWTTEQEKKRAMNCLFAKNHPSLLRVPNDVPLVLDA